MRKYLYIGMGGAAGAICRYALEQVKLTSISSPFPWNTLIINVSGSFLLTFILTIAFEAWEISSSIRLGIAVGFLGAFTTFSTFCKESVELFSAGELLTGTLYICASLILGLGLALLGMILARKAAKAILERKRAKQTAEE